MVRERSQFVPRCDCRSVSAKRVRRVVVQTELGRVAVDADELCFHGSRPSLRSFDRVDGGETRVRLRLQIACLRAAA